MGVNYFTKEQQELLKQNQYVQRVSNKSITYTEEFKDIFYKEYVHGKQPSEILRDMGFDIKILGQSRVTNIAQRMKANALRADGNEDLRKKNSGRPNTKKLTLEEELERLKHQNAVLRQQNEFLKKKEQIDRQAEWKKHRSTKRSN